MSDPWVLGISASHNGACCLLSGAEVRVAIQEERLVGQKRRRIYGARPSVALQYCLDTAGITVDDLDMIVLSAQAPRDDPDQDLARHPELQKTIGHVPTAYVPHHWAHAISAFVTSGYDEAAVLVVDGLGSPFEDLFDAERRVARGAGADGRESLSTYIASRDGLRPLDKHLVPGGRWLIRQPCGLWGFRSLGGMFSAVAAQLFGDPMEAGKVMGLAPYGSPVFAPEEFFVIRDGLVEYRDALQRRFTGNERWPCHEQAYADLAASAQQALEAALLEIARRLRGESGLPQLCYAGGVALNGIANQRLLSERVFDELHVIPAAEDSGVAIGAAYWGLSQLAGEMRGRRQRHDAPGRCYSAVEIDDAIRRTPFVARVPRPEVIDQTIEYLCEGQIGGWFQGGSELGPRALGQRSILCDPRRHDAKALLNSRVKHREAFRPFAPVIALESVTEWFDIGVTPASSPFMLRVCGFAEGKGPLVPGVCHVDGTGRLQSVEPGSRLYDLVAAFHARTGVPMLINTSFNVAGEPIVETPEDALWCLLGTGLDFCVLEDRVVRKDDAFATVLDLVPHVTALRGALDFESEDGRLQLAKPSALRVVVGTRWGETAHTLPVSHFRMLDLIDGQRNGWELLERLVPGPSEAVLVRELMLLRRLHVIAFTRPG